MKKYANLIRSICWSFARSSGIEYNELFSEAVLCYYESKHRFNKKLKVKKSTWLYKVISNHLITFIKNEQKIKTGTVPLENLNISFENKYIENFNESFSDLGQQLSRIIYDNEDLFTFDKAAKINRGILVQFLREELHWSWPMIWKSLSSIKEDLSKQNKYEKKTKIINV